MADENKTAVEKPKKKRVYKPKAKTATQIAIAEVRDKMKKLDKKSIEFSNAYAELQRLNVQYKIEKNAAEQRDIKAAKERAESAKRDAILKNFELDGFSTENDMKLLLEFNRILRQNGITEPKQLEDRLANG